MRIEREGGEREGRERGSTKARRAFKSRLLGVQKHFKGLMKLFFR